MPSGMSKPSFCPVYFVLLFLARLQAEQDTGPFTALLLFV